MIFFVQGGCIKRVLLVNCIVGFLRSSIALLHSGYPGRPRRFRVEGFFLGRTFIDIHVLMMSISLVAVEIAMVMCDTCCLVANETKNMFKDCVKDDQV